MADVVIRAEGLSKRYRIGEFQRYKALRDTLTNAFSAPFRAAASVLKGGSPMAASARSNSIIWALNDVSFEVNRGEVIGVIGHNGSGKSTLLKILSRVTEPTRGYAEIHGRVGSLLEVGTGFHPELTGRENIYLNGAILSMQKREIDRKFDEIVAFAEVEKFIDTPVKYYSSGMYLRLAFAVAAHLETEVLLVDEVLAVGDAQFQKKCMGKMGDIAQAGRTVLFVSHNMVSIRHLCSDAIWLDRGLIAKGAVYEVTERYLQHETPTKITQADIASAIRALPPDPTFRLHSIAIRQDGLVMGGNVLNGKPLQIEINYEVLHEVSGLRVYLDLCDEYGDVILRSFHDEDADERSTVQPRHYTSRAVIGANVLAPRVYTLVVHATVHCVRECIPGGIAIPLRVFHTGRINRAYVDEPFVGKLAPILEWRTRPAAIE